MSLGKAPPSSGLFRSSSEFCRERIPESSIYSLLYRESHRLLPDEMFADLFAELGRHSVPPRIVAVVMILQRIEGLSDREAVDRFTYDLRWKYACGGLDYDYPGFVHTVLCDLRMRLRRSDRPNRIFEVVLEVAKSAGLVGRRRILDSTALLDAVATQDTVTLIRSAIRGVLQVAGARAAALQAVLLRDDNYDTPGKPVCDWQDEEARNALVDALVRDGYAILTALEGCELEPELRQAVTLLATVLGQDIEPDPSGRFRLARGVAENRVISTVDPEARHGHKTSAHGFDGYKGHLAVDADSEIITAAEVTAGNAGDASAVESLLREDLPAAPGTVDDQAAAAVDDAVAPAAAAAGEPLPPLEVFGDGSYGNAPTLARLEQAGARIFLKVAPPSGRKGKYSKDAFTIDLAKKTVSCPAQVVVPIRTTQQGGGVAFFSSSCAGCSCRDQCTSSKRGRVIHLHPQEALLERHRQAQRHPQWKQRYRETRPKIERKIAHLTRRRHGGRRARVRGRSRVGADFQLLAAAINLRRLAILDLRHHHGRWGIPPEGKRMVTMSNERMVTATRA